MGWHCHVIVVGAKGVGSGLTQWVGARPLGDLYAPKTDWHWHRVISQLALDFISKSTECNE